MAKLSKGIMPLHKEMANIKEIVEACYEQIKEYRRGQVIEIKAQENMRLVLCDRFLITTLIHNVLLNAVTYSPDNSIIEIEVNENNNSMFLSIADEGEGIPEDMIEAVFDKFFRLPGTKSPGIGLGLSLAQKIAEIHNGVLKVANRPCRGAIFTLILPLNEN
jgi:two-component system sensor histidine kinase KdpD